MFVFVCVYVCVCVTVMLGLGCGDWVTVDTGDSGSLLYTADNITALVCRPPPGPPRPPPMPPSPPAPPQLKLTLKENSQPVTETYLQAVVEGLEAWLKRCVCVCVCVCEETPPKHADA